MNENAGAGFAETVVLVDAALLSEVVSDVKGYFEAKWERTMGEADLAVLAECMALDAGVKPGDGQVQFLFVYDRGNERLAHCVPGDLRTELDGVAFRGSCGEVLLAGVPCEGMVSRGELFADLLSMLLADPGVKRVAVAPSDEEYGDVVTEKLAEAAGKELFRFRMDEPTQAADCGWDLLFFPVMHALGIRADELEE